jgi:cyanophycin synthetase
MQDLARLNAVVVTSTKSCGVAVLNADDDRCARIAAEAPGQVIYFSVQPDNQVVERHIRARGRALVLRPRPDGETLCLIDGTETRILLAQEIPALLGDRAHVNVTNALAAAAVCLGLDIDLECVRQGLSTFTVSL